jgi:hypothetical protein
LQLIQNCVCKQAEMPSTSVAFFDRDLNESTTTL